MDGHVRAARMGLALANYAVAALNAAATLASGDARDALAALAWFGSGTSWLWQARQDGK